MRGLFGGLAAPLRKSASVAADGGAVAAGRNGGWLPLLTARSAVGLPVSQGTAMKVSTVFACVNIPAEDVARAVPKLYRKLPQRVLDDGRVMPGGRVEVTDHPVAQRFIRPNGYQDWNQFAGMMERCLGLKSNAYAVILTDRRGYPTQWIPMNPDKVTVMEAVDGSVFYRFAAAGNVERSIFDQLFRRTGSLTVPAEYVLHLQDIGFNMLYGSSRIGFAADAIGLAMAQEQVASAWMANGAKPSVVLVTDKELSEPAAKRIKAEWEELNGGLGRQGGTAVLEQGLRPETLSLKSTDMEFLASRNFQVEDICRFFRMPPHKVAKLERATNGNVAAQDADYLDNTLSPRFTRWERRLDFHFQLAEQGLEVDFDLSDLFRADLATRMATARQGFNGGILTANEARWVFDRSLPPIEGGDVLMAPTNMAATGSHASGSAPDGAGRPADSERLDKSASGVARLPFDQVVKGRADQPRDERGRWARTGGALLDLFEAAAKPGNSQAVVELGLVGNAGDVLKATGISVEGYQRAVDIYGVRHAIKHHGNAKTEAKRGQRAIARDDYRLIPEIVSKPDGIEPGGKTKLGRDVLRYAKTIDGVEYTYVAEVLTGRKRETMLTMYSRPVT